jgi:hypothetical protein
MAVAAIVVSSAAASAAETCGLNNRAIDATWPERAKWCATWDGGLVPGSLRKGAFHACEGGVLSGGYMTYPSTRCQRPDGTWAPEGKWGPLYDQVYGQSPASTGSTGSK